MYTWGLEVFESTGVSEMEGKFGTVMLIFSNPKFYFMTLPVTVYFMVISVLEQDCGRCAWSVRGRNQNKIAKMKKHVHVHSKRAFTLK